MSRVFAAIALAAVVACGEGSTEPARVEVVGTYQLQSYNGAALPVVVNQDANGRVEMTANTINVNADQTYSQIIGYRFVANSGAATSTQVSASGTYTAVNGAMSFTRLSPSLGGFSATVSGREMNIVDQGNLYVFRR